MHSYDYDYTVAKDNSPDIFMEICQKIEQAYPSAVKEKLLVDVDGSTIQTFTLEDKIIDVFDDYDIGAVYVKSDIELSNVLGVFSRKNA